MNKTFSLSTLPKTTTKSKKRIGRGHGSGKVKTSGRGTKGQNARGHMPLAFEGGQLSIIKRLPFLRGKGKNKSMTEKPFIVNIKQLKQFKDGTKITLELLKKADIINIGNNNVKILGSDNIKARLTVSLPCSKNAKASIEKAGGTVQVLS